MPPLAWDFRGFAIDAMKRAHLSTPPQSAKHGEDEGRDGERLALDLFDATVARELPKVSHLEYDSHKICKVFARRIREAMLLQQIDKAIAADQFRARLNKGYAPGDYMCHCLKCGIGFIGDKRAASCMACADAAIAAENGE